MTDEKAIERLEVMRDCYEMFFGDNGTAGFEEKYQENREAFDFAVAKIKNPFKWIPIRTRPLTKEEMKTLVDKFGLDASFYEYPSAFRYESPLPEDGDEVLVTTKKGFVVVVEYHDDSGFDEEAEADSFKAWAPLPKPYESEVRYENS